MKSAGSANFAAGKFGFSLRGRLGFARRDGTLIVKLADADDGIDDFIGSVAIGKIHPPH